MPTPFQSLDEFDQDNKFPHKSTRKIVDDLQEGFDGVQSIVAGPGITVDSTDPKNPIVSATFGTGGGGSGGSGGLWLKHISKQVGEPAENDILYTEKTVYGGIKGLAGNALTITLTIAALPGSNSEGAVIQVYAVPGEFTPSALVPYPEAIDTPVVASFAQMRVNDEENPLNDPADESVDHMEFTANITVPGFTGGKAQVVILSDSGAYTLLEYTEERIAHLDSADITSLYADIAAWRTGFTSGDVVTVTFTSIDAVPVHQIFLWSHDAAGAVVGYLHDIADVVGEPVATGTVQSNITAYNIVLPFDTKTLFVAAGRYGQFTTPISTTTAKIFDERVPDFPDAGEGSTSYDYPGSQNAIKGADSVDVTISNIVAGHSLTLAFDNTNVAAGSAGPYPIVAGEVTFPIVRGAEITFNGAEFFSIVATNTNNGKTAETNSLFVRIDVQSDTPPAPEIHVDGDNVVRSKVGGQQVPVQITSAVRLNSPTGLLEIPGISVGAFTTNDYGYTWQTTGTVVDEAAPSGERGLLNATITTPGTLTTAAGTAVASPLGGSYILSGFEQRARTITVPFSDTLDLAPLVVDSATDLIVQTAGFVTLVQGVDYSVSGNEITFLIPEFYNANASGTMFVYVEQEEGSY